MDVCKSHCGIREARMNIHRAVGRGKKKARASHISIRDLQKLSGDTILALPGPTAVTSGDRTVALLFPLRKPDPKRLDAVLKRAKDLAKLRDPKEDEAFLIEVGIDPTNYDAETVRAIQKDWLARR